MQLEERDLVIGNVYRKLMEIESRLLPCGLHVVGIMPSAAEAIATLVNIGEINRPDNNPPVKVSMQEWGTSTLWCFSLMGYRELGL